MFVVETRRKYVEAVRPVSPLEELLYYREDLLLLPRGCLATLHQLLDLDLWPMSIRPLHHHHTSRRIPPTLQTVSIMVPQDLVYLAHLPYMRRQQFRALLQALQARLARALR
jgi:hypothetical protein